MKHNAYVSLDAVLNFSGKVRDYDGVIDSFTRTATDGANALYEFCGLKIVAHAKQLERAEAILAAAEKKRENLGAQKEKAEERLKKTPETIKTSDGEGNVTEMRNPAYEAARKNLQAIDSKLNEINNIIGRIKDIMSALEREKNQLEGYLNSIKQKAAEQSSTLNNIKQANARAVRGLNKTAEAIGAYLSVKIS